jgi:hypothetical protein
MFFNRVNAANKLKAEMQKDENTELSNAQKKEIFQKSVMKAAREQLAKNIHAKVSCRPKWTLSLVVFVNRDDDILM